jgi:phosphoenolpyruvate carboxylase
MKMKEQIELLKDILEEYWVKDEMLTANVMTSIDEMRDTILDEFHASADENKRIINKIQKNKKRDISRVYRKFEKLLNNHKIETDLKNEKLHKELEDYKNE